MLLTSFCNQALTAIYVGISLITSSPVAQGAIIDTVPPISAILSGLPIRSLGGPSNRISCFSVYEADPTIIYIGSASGGVFKTDNGGAFCQPVFDKEGASSIGAVTVSQQNPNLVWVGTGESWRRNSVGWGDGIYKSEDGGKSWKNMGLKNSYSISRIVIHSKNNNIVVAAATGSTWGPNEERGIFRSTDGGKTWKKVLYSNALSGAADIVMDPKNPDNMLASLWEYYRKPYTTQSGGKGSGIYKSTDGGATWKKITKGIPQTDLGRAGFSYFYKNPKVVIAGIEYLAKGEGPLNRYRGGPKCFKSTDGGDSWVELSRDVETVEFGTENRITQKMGKDFTSNGRTFYDCPPRQDPVDENRIYFISRHIVSVNGGKSFTDQDPNVQAIGGDIHEVWIDPKNNRHILIADDYGLNETWGKKNDFSHDLANMAVGQFYSVGYDMRKPYWVYGVMQDNGSWSIPTQTRHGGVTQMDAVSMAGDEGGQAKADPEDWTTVYTADRLENIMRTNQLTGEEKRIQPFSITGSNMDDAPFVKDRDSNLTKMRASWTAPFIISPFNHKTLYFGGNILFKSIDRGDTWTAISPDLSNNYEEWRKWAGAINGGITSDWSGAEFSCLIRTISESPLKQGMIWVGTDDGNVQLTMDDGQHWTNMNKNIPGLPKDTWVSHIYASKYKEGRAYATFDGHRLNDFNTYVYVTEDYGKTWTNINGNLPKKESCYVIKEGQKNPDLLFIGTEFSLWVSLDRGKSWGRYQDYECTSIYGRPLQGYFPTVAIYDMEIHRRELELIIGTHGRSLWILPVNALEDLTAENLAKDVYFTKPGNAYLMGRSSRRTGVRSTEEIFGGFSPNTQPGTLFSYYLKQPAKGKANIKVYDPAGIKPLIELTGPAKAGLNSVAWGVWDPITVGDYRVVLTIDGKEYYQSVHVEDAIGNELFRGSVR